MQKFPTSPMIAPHVVQFLSFFCRFEFALKRAGFLMHEGRHENQDAQASWDAFADELGKSFLELVSANPDGRFLVECPPRRQIVRDGQLGWDPEEPRLPAKPEDTKRLFVYVRRVRNNLFHGGKVPFDTHRDTELILSALKILQLALERAPQEVRDAFNSPS